MPQNQPLVGEVWETQLEEGAPMQAAVADVNPSQVFLLSRQGRIVVVPLKSLLLVWKPLVIPPPQPCMELRCQALSCAHTIDERWFCKQHLPRNVPLLLPGDTASSPRMIIGDLERCPLCKASRQAGRVSWQLIHELVMYSCSCNARWIMLIPKEGARMSYEVGEDILAAHTILETELCLDIKVLVGHVALTALKSAFRELRQGSLRFSGIPLREDDAAGAGNVLLMGKPPASNVMDGSIALNSRWAHKEKHLVLQVFAIEDDVRDDRQILLYDRADDQAITRIPEDQLKEAFQPAPETGVPRHSEAVEGLVPERWTSRQPSSSSPLPGQIWHHGHADGAMQVWGVGVDDQGTDFVRVQQGRLSFKMALRDFLRYSSFEKVDALQVGQEYVGPGGESYRIIQVDSRTVRLLDSSNTPVSYPVTEFRSLFSPVSDEGALDMILEDDPV